jgi:hypothetical protein
MTTSEIVSIVAASISGLALLVSVVALVFSRRADAKSHQNAVRATELQEQMVKIEQRRDEERLVQRQRASLSIKLNPLWRNERVRAWQLVLNNNGSVEARNIRVSLDGRSIDDIDWIVKQKPLKEMTLGAGAPCNWHIGSNWRPPPWHAIVEWDDESGQPGRYQTTLTQLY